MTNPALKPLSELRIMLVNDDGIDAPGIKILEDIARQISNDVWVIAPAGECSGFSRSISIRDIIDVEQRGDKSFAVGGTPTDCTLLAVDQIMQHAKPDIILSGINAGGNLGEDIGYSGTCGAAFEAQMLGIPAIAFSQVRKKHGETDEDTFDASKSALPDLLPNLIEYALATKGLINVNVPACKADEVKGVRVAHQGQRLDTANLVEAGQNGNVTSYRFSFSRDDRHDRPGSDLDSVQNNFVSVTPLSIDFTDYRALTSLTVGLNLHR